MRKFSSRTRTRSRGRKRRRRGSKVSKRIRLSRGGYRF